MSTRRLALRTAQAFLMMLGSVETIALLYTMNTWMMCTAISIGALAYTCLYGIIRKCTGAL